MPIPEKYDPTITAKKAVYPVIVIAIVEAAAAALTTAGITIDKAVLYTVAVSGYAALIAFVNWFKNRKKKINTNNVAAGGKGMIDV